MERYTDYIQVNKEWGLTGIYADDGIGGINTKKSEEFNRMIEACIQGRTDMVINKSVCKKSMDCLKYLRQLKEKNITEFFEIENINTMYSKGEVILPYSVGRNRECKAYI